MIQGVVNARHEAIVCLRVRGSSGVEADVDTIVDSGFTSSLTLPIDCGDCPQPRSTIGWYRSTCGRVSSSVRHLLRGSSMGRHLADSAGIRRRERVAVGNAPVDWPQVSGRGSPRRFGGNPSTAVKHSRLFAVPVAGMDKISAGRHGG